MKKLFKSPFLILVLGVFLLTGCQEENSKEVFLNLLKADREAGFSFRKITNKIYFKHYPGVPDLLDEGLEEFSEEVSDFDFEEEEKAQALLIKNIKEKNCPAVFETLNVEEEDFLKSGSFLAGVFFDEGICVEKDPTISLKIYQANFEEFPTKSVAARLGNLYLKGRGVIQDKEVADYYFSQAVMLEPSFFWIGSIPGFDTFDVNSLNYKIWGLSSYEMQIGFTEIETGPWDLPQPLLDKIEWVTSLAKNHGEEARIVAEQIFLGTGGFEKDRELAFKWLERIGDYLQNEDAKFEAILMRVSKDFCPRTYIENSVLDCADFNASGLTYMGEAAMSGNPRAIRFLIDYYTQNPGKNWAEWDLYLLYLLSEKGRLSFPRDVLANLNSSLSEFEKNILKAWLETSGFSLISESLPN